MNLSTTTRCNLFWEWHFTRENKNQHQLYRPWHKLHNPNKQTNTAWCVLERGTEVIEESYWTRRLWGVQGLGLGWDTGTKELIRHHSHVTSGHQTHKQAGIEHTACMHILQADCLYQRLWPALWMWFREIPREHVSARQSRVVWIFVMQMPTSFSLREHSQPILPRAGVKVERKKKTLFRRQRLCSKSATSFPFRKTKQTKKYHTDVQWSAVITSLWCIKSDWASPFLPSTVDSPISRVHEYQWLGSGEVVEARLTLIVEQVILLPLQINQTSRQADRQIRPHKRLAARAWGFEIAIL